jgi:hypothetical protein
VRLGESRGEVGVVDCFQEMEREVAGGCVGVGEIQWVLRRCIPAWKLLGKRITRCTGARKGRGRSKSGRGLTDCRRFLRKPGGSTAAPTNDYDGLAA